MADMMRRGQVLHYVRYMDDIVILTKSRWQLKRAVAVLHAEFASLGLRAHQTKRFVGRLRDGDEVGFDFCGYQFVKGRKLRVSAEGHRRHLARIRQLIEQGASLKRLREYVNRWLSWVHGGLKGLVEEKGGEYLFEQNKQVNWRLPGT
jgi:RNA-directed DNA polymerase